MEERLARRPELMRLRRSTVEHVFGTIKGWMGATHFLTRGLENVRTETSLQVLAFNLKRLISIIGIAPLLAAIRRSEEHTSELQSLMRISYAVFCLKKTTHKL